MGIENYETVKAEAAAHAVKELRATLANKGLAAEQIETLVGGAKPPIIGFLSDLWMTFVGDCAAIVAKYCHDHIDDKGRVDLREWNSVLAKLNENGVVVVQTAK